MATLQRKSLRVGHIISPFIALSHGDFVTHADLVRLSRATQRQSQRILRNLQRFAIVHSGQVTVIAGDSHMQRIDHIDRRFTTAKNGVDKVVTEVAVRAAMSARPNSRRQSVFLNL
jgi:hypothetical protein